MFLTTRKSVLFRVTGRGGLSTYINLHQFFFIPKRQKFNFYSAGSDLSKSLTAL